MLTWNEKDLVWCPSVGLDGQILRIDGDRAQIWWADDIVSWEPLDVLEKPEELHPVSDWPKCPACGSERWHHLGDFEYKPTGRTVDVAVLDALPIATLHEPDAKPTVTLPWHIEPGVERLRLVPRECRDCAHTWREDTSKTDAIRAEQP